MRVKNYEKTIAALNEKITKKETELKKLKEELAAAQTEFEQEKNKELLALMAEKKLSASDAVDLLKKALENN